MTTLPTLDTQLSERHEGDESGRCGGCGSRNIMVTEVQDSDVTHGICMDCKRIQEVEHRDWPLSVMCDNCAFRKGSPERADPYRWAQILDTLDDQQPFHCHKGLPMSQPDKDGNVHFEAPNCSEGRVKICAGWFAMHVKSFERAEAEK